MLLELLKKPDNGQDMIDILVQYVQQQEQTEELNDEISHSTLMLIVGECMKNWSVPLHEKDQQDWDRIANFVGMNLAGYNAQAVKPLIEIYNSFGPKIFFDLAFELCTLSLTKHLICWAFCYCNNDVTLFIGNIKSKDRAMIEYVNQQAELWECYHPRMKLNRVNYYLIDKSCLNRSYQFNEPFKHHGASKPVLETIDRQQNSSLLVLCFAIVLTAAGVMMAVLKWNSFTLVC